MKDQDNYTTSFTVDRTPEQAFAAINNVRAWWSGHIDGDTDRVGATFTYRYGDVHRSKQVITELIPGKRVVWHVTEGHLSYVKHKGEWSGTDIVFALTRTKRGVEVRFTHIGLVPTFECYGECTSGWSALINGNLQKLVTTGEAQPDPFA